MPVPPSRAARVGSNTLWWSRRRGVPPQGGSGGGYDDESKMENEDELKVSSVGEYYLNCLCNNYAKFVSLFLQTYELIAN